MAAKQYNSTAREIEIDRQIEKNREELVNAAMERFEARFAEWLSTRSEALNPYPSVSDERWRQLRNREEELARLITTTPADAGWMILKKLEIIEYYLGGDDGTAWIDNREIVMIAGVKADLLRFEPKGA